MNSLNRAASFGLFALSCTFLASRSPALLASDASFQGVVVSQRETQFPADRDKDSHFGGVVIDDQRGASGQSSTAARRALGLALPAAEARLHDSQRLHADRKPPAARIGVSIGIGIGRSQSSPAPAKKSVPIRPIR